MKTWKDQSSFLDAIKVPEGWTKEYVEGMGILLTYRGEDCRGMVTIDFNKRAFTPGACSVTRPATSTKYAGRNWQEKIVADAMEHLKQVMA